MRIDQLLNQPLFGSRGNVKRLLKSGQVRVDGKVVRQGKQNVDPGIQRIEVAGQRIISPVESYFLLYKPIGVVTACSDAQYQTVLDCLAVSDRVAGMYPIGRLDRNAEGLVLLSTNGPLGYRLLHPQYHVAKVYQVTVNGLLTEADVIAFQQGIVFDDGSICQPAKLELDTVSLKESVALVTVYEGRRHQVKKMFLARGVKVTRLIRVQFGPFHLPSNWQAGDYRTFNQQELQLIGTYLNS